MINKIIGDNAEAYVSGLYRKKGYKIIARNYKTRFGELDVVAQKADDVVIIEVKSRAENSLIPIWEAIPQSKQNKVRISATAFLKEMGLLEKNIRFDAAFIIHKEGKTLSCDIIENAF